MNPYYFEDIKENLKAKSGPTYPRGTALALRAFEDTVRHDSSCFEVREMPTIREEIVEFCDTLIEAGISEFALTANQTGTIEIMHHLNSLGWVYDGLCVVVYLLLPEGFKESIGGIRFIFKGGNA